MVKKKKYACQNCFLYTFLKVLGDDRVFVLQDGKELRYEYMLFIFSSSLYALYEIYILGMFLLYKEAYLSFIKQY